MSLTLDPVLKLLGDLPKEIPGGEIIQDPGLGVLCDAAATLVENISPIKTEEERTATLKRAMKDLNSVGIVGVHEAGVFPENIELYQKYLENYYHNLIIDWSMPGKCHFEYMQWPIVRP
jgi:predicted amidohydrolase YtcJ